MKGRQSNLLLQWSARGEMIAVPPAINVPLAMGIVMPQRIASLDNVDKTTVKGQVLRPRMTVAFD